MTINLIELKNKTEWDYNWWNNYLEKVIKDEADNVALIYYCKGRIAGIVDTLSMINYRIDKADKEISKEAGYE